MKVAAGPLDQVPTKQCVAIGNGQAVIVRLDDQVVAFPNRCLHQDSPLAGGIVLDRVLVCPLHFWRYQLPEGLHMSGVRLQDYPVAVVDGQVFVDVPDPAPKLSMREMLLQHAREWEQQAEIKAVVWDMGGVFRRYFTEVLLDVATARGWPLQAIPLGPTGRSPDLDYDAMAQGEMTEPEYLDRLRRRLAGAGIEYDPVNDPDWEEADRPETWEAIRRIADSSVKQAILTNDASLWMGDGWWETWAPAKYFDSIVDVATLGMRKPDPETYRTAIRLLNLRPHECLFVDDMPVNCRGAEAVGMQSLFFDITAPHLSIERLMERINL